MLTPTLPDELPESVFAAERQALDNCKKAVIAVLGSVALRYRDKASEQQEVLAAASDMIMDVYAMESAIMRTEKAIGLKGEASCALQIDATRVFASDAIQRIEQRAKTAIAAMSEGDDLRMMMGVLRRYMKFIPVNTVAARRRIADAVIEAGRYNLS